MIDSVIFDLDGTLIDSRPQVRTAWGRTVTTLTGHSWEITEEAFTALFGRPMDEIAGFLFPDELDEAECLRKAALCYEAENAWLREHPVMVFPGSAETLRYLAHRYPLYIVSNCQRGYIEAALEPHGLLIYFRDWLCFGDTGTPKGITIRRLMQLHELRAPIYVGDTQGDEDACHQAGIPFVYAAWGFGRALHPDRTCSQITELIRLCAGEEAL